MKRTNIANRIIVACSQNFNGYGMLRSLGEAGIRPTMLINHCKNPIIRYSRFKGEIRYYNYISEIPSLLIKYYASEPVPPIVICCDDAIQSIVDDNSDAMRNKFILSTIGGVKARLQK